MNNEKIGKFILELRKQKGMTQKELAEKVGVSDKTISKWECGNSIPDITYLEVLCNSLNISVNELLSGERLTSESYSEKAEENIMALMKENKISKNGVPWKVVFGILLCFISMLYTSWSLGGISMFWFLYDIPTLLIYALLCIGCIMLSGQKTKSDKLDFLQKIAIPNGALIAIIQFVFILARLDDLSVLGPAIAVGVLVLLYSLVLYVVVTILKTRCEKE